MKGKNWGFDTKTIDAKVRPQDDFYSYAHGKWLKNTKIPANESRWGAFVILHVETQKKLKKLVEKLSKGKFPGGSAEQMIRDFYKAGLDEARREKLGLSPITPWLAKIEKLRTRQDVENLLIEFHRLGVDVFWGTMIDQDSKDSSRYALHFYQDGIGMPERDYYLKDDVESKRVRDAYLKHIERMHRLIGLPAAEARRAREVVMRMETALAKASMTKEDARDSEKIYHKYLTSKLDSVTKHVDWKRYLAGIGAGKEKSVIVMQPDFVRAAGNMIDTASLEDLKTYFRWHLLLDTAGALSKKFVKEQFAFYGKVLSGSKKMKPIWRRALASTNGALGELVGQVYVKEHFVSEAKIRMSKLVDDLFAAYEARIKALDWMSPATKKKALLKLRMTTRKIGYPDKWKSYRGLVVRPDDYFGNLLRSTEYEHQRAMKKLGRPIDRTEWFMTPQTVNAYNGFNMNEIVFPAAILQPPFFSLHADDAVNYGSIGSVIGHELTHGFDDQGAKFDGNGNMRTWWKPKDMRRFKKKAELVKKQFDAYTVADGVHVNGQLTLGENIADLGGAAIAYDAYQMHLARTGSRKDVDGFTPEQRFFFGLAIFERELARPEFEKTQVLTDPHSPGKFRINGPASNLAEFYIAFGVRKGDKLYRESKDRAKIW